jgi:GMP synthase-like glutamine amidotransferase
MKVLAVVHQPDAGPGVFADAVRETGHELLEWSPRRGPSPDLDGIGAVLVLGGAMNFDEEAEHPWLAGEKELLRRVLDQRLPVLGVCLGSQLLAEVAGARVGRASTPEIGWRPVEVLPAGAEDPLFGPLPERFDAFEWHSYEFEVPPRAAALARSGACLQGYRLNGPGWGIQFHAEVTRESIERWTAGYRRDPDAIRIGLDPARLIEDSAHRIGRWNGVGLGICARFLEAAEHAV